MNKSLNLFSVSVIATVLLLGSITMGNVAFADTFNGGDVILEKEQAKAINKAMKEQRHADNAQLKADQEQETANNTSLEKQDRAQMKADKKQQKADQSQEKSCKKIQKLFDKLSNKGISIPAELTIIFTDNCVA